MLVSDCMTRHPILVQRSMLASEARQLMAENKIRHLPVVGDGKQLQGLVIPGSFSLDPGVLGSVDVWEITSYLGSMTVGDVMKPAAKVSTVVPDRTIERAARQMIDEKASCLVVLEDDNVVVGVLTEIDLLNAFQQMLGLPADGVRVTMRMPDRPGEFIKLTTVLGQQNWGVMGIGTFPTPRKPGYYDAVIKLPKVTVAEVREVLSQVPDQQIIDVREIA